jgi:2-keto-3-deoxy-L-rhamnonate aldolase RhmA
MVKKKIKTGKLVLGISLPYNDFEQIKMAAQLGYDFVRFEGEHDPHYGVEHMVRAIEVADAVGITPFVRVAESNPVLIMKALEIGAYGVTIPHIESKEECELVVSAAKFPPEGIRGCSNDFLRRVRPPPGVPDWKFANEQTMVIVLALESKKAIDNIEGILSVKGLDMISLSIGDISFALGHPGEPMHPDVVKARDHALELCKKYGVTPYCVDPHDPENRLLKYYYRKGVRVFTSEPSMRKAYQDHIKELHKILS